MAETGPTLIQSVQRALRLVEAVAARPSPPTAKQLSRTTGIALSTTYHLLRTLTHDDYLTRRADGTYVIGAALAAVADRPSAYDPIDDVRRTMRGLRDHLQAPVYLALYRDGEISIVEVCDSRGLPAIDLWVAIHDAAHATALGKGILSNLTDDARADYLSRHPLHALTSRTVTDRPTFERQVARPAAVSRDNGEYLPGVRCLAVPVVSPRYTGAIGISRAWRGGQTAADRTAADLLATAAAQISRSLHLRDSPGP